MAFQYGFGLGDLRQDSRRIEFTQELLKSLSNYRGHMPKEDTRPP